MDRVIKCEKKCVFHQNLIAYCYVIDVEIMVRLLLMFLRYKSGKWKTILEKTK